MEGYLYGAHGHRALEASVLAAGERLGYSERMIERASLMLGCRRAAGCWELPAHRVDALDADRLVGVGADAFVGTISAAAIADPPLAEAAPRHGRLRRPLS